MAPLPVGRGFLVDVVGDKDGDGTSIVANRAWRELRKRTSRETGFAVK